MSRLSESVRDEVVQTIADWVRAPHADEVQLLARLNKIAKKSSGFFIAGESRDGVPGIEHFLNVRLVQHLTEIFHLTEPFTTKDLPSSTQFADQMAGDADRLAAEIVREFESWPRLYEFVVPLPFPRSVFSQVFEADRYFLNDEVRVEVLSRRDFDMLVCEPGQPDWYVLRVVTPGFKIADRDDKLGRAEAARRQFLGLAIAAGIIDPGAPTQHDKRTTPLSEVSVEVGQMTSMDFAASSFLLPETACPCEADLSQDESAVILALTLLPEYGSPRLSDDLGDWPSTKGGSAWASDAPRLRRSLRELAQVFYNKNRRLLDAGEWLFSSYLGTNQSLQMVQAMTTLEILFGGSPAEQEGVGLTKLLANRCAYLLGTDHADRDRICKQIKNLYDVRSSIVHSGKRRLDDENQLREARLMCKRAIKRELRFMAVADPP